MAIIDMVAGESGGAYEPLPNGDYNIQINSTELGTSSGGHQQLEVKFTVVDGPHAGKERTMWYFLTAKGGFRTRGLLEALQIPYQLNGKDSEGRDQMRWDTDHLINRYVTVFNKQREYDKEMKDNFKNERPCLAYEPHLAPAMQPQYAPPQQGAPQGGPQGGPPPQYAPQPQQAYAPPPNGQPQPAQQPYAPPAPQQAYQPPPQQAAPAPHFPPAGSPNPALNPAMAQQPAPQGAPPQGAAPPYQQPPQGAPAPGGPAAPAVAPNRRPRPPGQS